jgi:hypothetical protein
MSMSIAPTWTCSSAASANDRAAAKVDLPTPPLPLRTRILCFIVARRAWRSGRSGSGPLGREAQMDWLGHPSQLSAIPLTNQHRQGMERVNTLGLIPCLRSARLRLPAHPTGPPVA